MEDDEEDLVLPGLTAAREDSQPVDESTPAPAEVDAAPEEDDAWKAFDELFADAEGEAVPAEGAVAGEPAADGEAGEQPPFAAADPVEGSPAAADTEPAADASQPQPQEDAEGGRYADDEEEAEPAVDETPPTQGEAAGGGGQDVDDEAADQEEAGPSGREMDEDVRNQQVLAMMTEAQMERYIAYKRSKLPQRSMKKLMQQLLGTVPSDKMLIALSGIGKMFVGDLVEMGRHVAASEGHSGPLLPRHILRAYQVLDENDKVPHVPAPKRRMFG